MKAMPRRLAALAVFALLTGCQSLYFQPACHAQQFRLTDRDRHPDPGSERPRLMVDGRWVAVDPTFGQPVADATHIKLLEGEALADLLPLIDWVGRVRIRVLALEHRSP